MKNEKLAEIVEEVWQDRENNFSKLFDACWGTVYYLSYKKLNNKYDAEDVTQEVMVYIFNHIGELQSAEAFNRWMFKIVFGKCNDFLSKKLRLKEVSAEQSYDQPLVTTGVNQEDYIKISENNEYVLSLINRLSDKQKEVVILHYYGEMTAIQISEILDCSVEAVKNRLYQARKFLKGYSEKDNVLYGVSFLPLLLGIFTAEQSTICGGEIGPRIWKTLEGNLISKLDNTVEHKQNRSQKRSTPNWRWGIGVIATVLVGIVIVVISSLAGRSQNPVTDEPKSNQYVENEPIETGRPSNSINDEPRTEQGISMPLVSDGTDDNQQPQESQPLDDTSETELPFSAPSHPDHVETAGEQVNGPDIRPFPLEKPHIIILNNELVYQVGAEVTGEKVLMDGEVSAFDGDGTPLEVEIFDWSEINWQNPGVYGIYLEAFDHYGNTTGRKAISIEIRP